MKQRVTVPDIGDFKNVPVMEVLVRPGQRVTADTPLLSLESDKATLEVPAPLAGRVEEILVKPGDRVSQGSAIAIIAVEEGQVPGPPPVGDLHAEILVIGGGPGGYTAAFRAADLGRKVVLVEKRGRLGGVCLNVGCIPSKALLHAARLVEDAKDFAGHGIGFGDPAIDLDRLRGWKDGIVARLTGGLASLARQRRVTIVQGEAAFDSANSVAVSTDVGARRVGFDKAIIAVGSEPVTLPFIPDDPRVLDSTAALDLKQVPRRLLVLGGGIIGLEMATVYHALGSQVTIVEMMGQLIPGADPDIVAPLAKRIGQRYRRILTKTRVTAIETRTDGLLVRLEGPQDGEEALFDAVLVAVGRRPNGGTVSAAAAGVAVDARGFIPVDGQMRTNLPHILAIGDVAGMPMLAHKAVHEGKVAAEVAAGHDHAAFVARVIPSVAYTDPEVAWVGLTETEAKARGIAHGRGVFPWAASGRSLSLGRDEGVTKLLFDPQTRRLLGAGIVGPGAGELIAEAALAIEMGADADDVSLTIHAHPTLSETIGLAAEVFQGTVTDLLN